MATPESNNCKVCGLKSSKHCSRCVEGIDATGSPTRSETHYCSVSCQAADWERHKDQCNRTRRLKKLYRGAQFLQDVLLAFREEAFDLKVWRIEERDDRLDAYETPTTFDDPAFHPFPNHLVKSAKDKQAVLTLLSCSDVATVLHQLVNKAFRGTFQAQLFV
jgi:hypothetical protein